MVCDFIEEEGDVTQALVVYMLVWGRHVHG